jgi:Ca2+-binding EF-hand superfamily protein
MPRASSDLVKHAVRLLDKSGDGVVSREELSEAVLEQGVFGHLLAGLSNYDVSSRQICWF